MKYTYVLLHTNLNIFNHFFRHIWRQNESYLYLDVNSSHMKNIKQQIIKKFDKIGI